MTLTVFQIGVDMGHSQLLDTDEDVEWIFGRPGNGESVAGRPWPATLKLFDPYEIGLYFEKLWDERSGPVPNRSTQIGIDN